jgi:endoglucanase
MHSTRSNDAPRALRFAARVLPLLILTMATPLAADPPASGPPADVRLWVDPNTPARQQADSWRASRPDDARVLDRIAEQPQAVWFGEWNRDVRRDVKRVVDAASAAGALPVLVAYNIPQRDCGSYSAGGAKSADAYRRWVRAFAGGLRSRGAMVVLEPDALAAADCLGAAARDERTSLLRDAVSVLKAAGAYVYIDAGHGRWHSPREIASRLSAAGIAAADGFALNVSNFHGNSLNVQYGEEVSDLVGGKHFVIDSSRNGLGTASPDEWCNPAGQALGTRPTTRTAHPRVDAFLWVKRPGESDGSCNGGPEAGQWWAEYALGLASRQTNRMASAMALTD